MGKKGGEMKTQNLDGLALHCIHNIVSSNYMHERKRDKRFGLMRQRK